VEFLGSFLGEIGCAFLEALGLKAVYLYPRCYIGPLITIRTGYSWVSSPVYPEKVFMCVEIFSELCPRHGTLLIFGRSYFGLECNKVAYLHCKNANLLWASSSGSFDLFTLGCDILAPDGEVELLEFDVAQLELFYNIQHLCDGECRPLWNEYVPYSERNPWSGFMFKHSTQDCC
jgi:hypothetical protein